MIIRDNDLEVMEKRYRAALINSITGFKPLNLCGTMDEKGNTNVAIFSSVFHLGSDPALIGMINRPNTVPRHTLENIESTGTFTLNAVDSSFYRSAHQTAARYDEEVSEFDATGLTPIYLEGFPAPFVKESPLKIGLNFKERIDIKLNGTHLIIGEVILIDVDKSWISKDGSLDLGRSRILAGSGLDRYYRMQPLDRLTYPKPDRDPNSILDQT